MEVRSLAHQYPLRLGLERLLRVLLICVTYVLYLYKLDNKLTHTHIHLNKSNVVIASNYIVLGSSSFSLKELIVDLRNNYIINSISEILQI